MRSIISIPGSLSFTKLVMMSSVPAKSTGDDRYASQDPFIQSTLSHTISTPICIRTAFFLRPVCNLVPVQLKRYENGLFRAIIFSTKATVTSEALTFKRNVKYKTRDYYHFCGDGVERDSLFPDNEMFFHNPVLLFLVVQLKLDVM